MKKLVVYYSYSGANKKISEAISERLGADLEEIVDLTDRRNVFKTYVFGGFQALRKIKVPIQELKNDLRKYDRVIVCSPVWAGSLPPAIRSFLAEHKGKMTKPIFLFICGAGEDNRPKIVPELEKIMDRRNLPVMFVKNNNLNSESSQKQIFEYLNND